VQTKAPTNANLRNIEVFMNHLPAKSGLKNLMGPTLGGLCDTAMTSRASLIGCATTPGPATIADTAARTPHLSTLNRLIGRAGLIDTLRGPGPFTVFAPSDEAFRAVAARTMAEPGTDKELPRAVLTYHVMPGKVAAAEVRNSNAKAVNGANLALAKAGDMVTVEDAVVTQADVPATNGVVHVIDRVLLPPTR
jgi:uncharacterized surface protein with fasciclin (FAS1) repeats